MNYKTILTLVVFLVTISFSQYTYPMEIIGDPTEVAVRTNS